MAISTAAASIKARGKNSGRFIPSSSGQGAGGGTTISQLIKAGAVRVSGGNKTINETIAAKLPEVQQKAAEAQDIKAAQKLKAEAQAQYSGQTRAAEYAARLRASAAVPIAPGSKGFTALSERRAQEAEGVNPTIEKYTAHFFQVRGKEGAVGFSHDLGKPAKAPEKLSPLFMPTSVIDMGKSLGKGMISSAIGLYKTGQEKISAAFNASDTFLTEKYNQYNLSKYNPMPNFDVRVLAESQKYYPQENKNLKGIPRFFSYMTTSAVGDVLGFESGYYKGLKEQPTKTAVNTAIFFGLPFGLKIAGKAVGSSKLLSTAWEITEPTVVGAIAGSYLKGISTRVKKAKYPAQELGVISSTEITPMLVGGYAGVKTASSLEGIWRTKGLTFNSVNYIVREDVIKGAENFPVAPTATHYQIFLGKTKVKYSLPNEQGRFMWHVSPNKFGATFKTTTGSSELPMFYGSSEASIYFAKIRGSNEYLFNIETLNPYSTPTIVRQRVDKFIQMPRWFKPKKTPDELAELAPGFTLKSQYLKETEFILTELKEGEAFVPGIKTEIEAGIKADTKNILEDKKFFTKIPSIRAAQKYDFFIRGEKQEAVLRVKPAKWYNPTTWVDAISGRKAGQFKSFGIKKGTRVPIEQFKIDYSGKGATKIKPTAPEKPANFKITEDYLYGKKTIVTPSSLIVSKSLTPLSISFKPSSIASRASSVKSMPSSASRASSALSSVSSIVSRQSATSSVFSSKSSSSSSKSSSASSIVSRLSYSSRASRSSSASSISSIVSGTSTTSPISRKAKYGGNVFIPKSKKDKIVKFKPKYFASVEASAFNIRGKANKWASITGLGIRPIRR